MATTRRSSRTTKLPARFKDLVGDDNKTPMSLKGKTFLSSGSSTSSSSSSVKREFGVRKNVNELGSLPTFKQGMKSTLFRALSENHHPLQGLRAKTAFNSDSTGKNAKLLNFNSADLDDDVFSMSPERGRDVTTNRGLEFFSENEIIEDSDSVHGSEEEWDAIVLSEEEENEEISCYANVLKPEHVLNHNAYSMDSGIEDKDYPEKESFPAGVSDPLYGGCFHRSPSPLDFGDVRDDRIENESTSPHFENWMDSFFADGYLDKLDPDFEDDGISVGTF